MPQASPELRAKFPMGDNQALDVLEKNFEVSRDWIIYPKEKGYKATAHESDAIHYLCDEWDFSYMSTIPASAVLKNRRDAIAGGNFAQNAPLEFKEIEAVFRAWEKPAMESGYMNEMWNCLFNDLRMASEHKAKDARKKKRKK